MSKKLNVGSGQVPFEGNEWVNLDLRPHDCCDLHVHADAHQLPFKDEVFDEVLTDSCVMVFTDERAILECLRVLKPGGIFSIYVYVETVAQTLQVIGEVGNTNTLKFDVFNHSVHPETNELLAHEFVIVVRKEIRDDDLGLCEMGMQ